MIMLYCIIATVCCEESNSEHYHFLRVVSLLPSTRTLEGKSIKANQINKRASRHRFGIYHLKIILFTFYGRNAVTVIGHHKINVSSVKNMSLLSSD